MEISVDDLRSIILRSMPIGNGDEEDSNEEDPDMDQIENEIRRHIFNQIVANGHTGGIIEIANRNNQHEVIEISRIDQGNESNNDDNNTGYVVQQSNSGIIYVNDISEEDENTEDEDEDGIGEIRSSENFGEIHGDDDDPSSVSMRSNDLLSDMLKDMMSDVSNTRVQKIPTCPENSRVAITYCKWYVKKSNPDPSAWTMCESCYEKLDTTTRSKYVRHVPHFWGSNLPSVNCDAHAENSNTMLTIGGYRVYIELYGDDGTPNGILETLEIDGRRKFFVDPRLLKNNYVHIRIESLCDAAKINLSASKSLDIKGFDMSNSNIFRRRDKLPRVSYDVHSNGKSYAVVTMQKIQLFGSKKETVNKCKWSARKPCECDITVNFAVDENVDSVNFQIIPSISDEELYDINLKCAKDFAIRGMAELKGKISKHVEKYSIMYDKFIEIFGSDNDVMRLVDEEIFMDATDEFDAEQIKLARCYMEEID